MFKIEDTVVAKIKDKQFSDKPIIIKTKITDIQPNDKNNILVVLYKNGFEMGEFFPPQYQGQKGWYILESDVIMSVV